MVLGLVWRAAPPPQKRTLSFNMLHGGERDAPPVVRREAEPALVHRALGVPGGGVNPLKMSSAFGVIQFSSVQFRGRLAAALQPASERAAYGSVAPPITACAPRPGTP